MAEQTRWQWSWRSRTGHKWQVGWKYTVFYLRYNQNHGTAWLPDFDNFRPNLRLTELKYSRFLCKTEKEPGVVIIEKLRLLALYPTNNIRANGAE